MIGDKSVLDVYLGESQIANITLIDDQLMKVGNRQGMLFPHTFLCMKIFHH
ncbi:Uncharacterised protein [Legionella pneumophila]|nr:Uncharacterised protein [Legionella pneumophila]CZI49156.1 Uncharacterised protein [Legionella pneumophila]